MSAQKGIQDYSDLNAFGNTLQQVMNVGTSCTANLALSATPLQFNSAGPYPSPVQTVIPGTSTPIIKEIDYPMPGSSPGVYVPNTQNPLITYPGSYAGWNVSQIGIQVQGSPGPNQYYITIEVKFQKKQSANGQTLSLGGQNALRQVTSLLVTTTGTNVVTVTNCTPQGASAFGGGSYGTLPTPGSPLLQGSHAGSPLSPSYWNWKPLVLNPYSNLLNLTSSSGGTFTISQGGKYALDYSLLCKNNGAGTGTCWAQLTKNGTAISSSQSGGSLGVAGLSFLTINSAVQASLNPGDVIGLVGIADESCITIDLGSMNIKYLAQ